LKRKRYSTHGIHNAVPPPSFQICIQSRVTIIIIIDMFNVA